jgi:hypothetical protein
MNSLDIFSTQKVRYNGRYEFDAVYQQVFDFLENLRYDVWEKSYKRDATNNKLDVRIEAQREINAMIRRRIIIKFQAYDMEEYQVETKDGRKSMCDGRLIISITGYADIDYRDIFTGPGWREWLGDVIFTTIRRGLFKKYFGPNYFAPIYKDCAKLRGTLNGALGRNT